MPPLSWRCLPSSTCTRIGSTRRSSPSSTTSINSRTSWTGSARLRLDRKSVRVFHEGSESSWTSKLVHRFSCFQWALIQLKSFSSISVTYSSSVYGYTLYYQKGNKPPSFQFYVLLLLSINSNLKTFPAIKKTTKNFTNSRINLFLFMFLKDFLRFATRSDFRGTKARSAPSLWRQPRRGTSSEAQDEGQGFEADRDHRSDRGPPVLQFSLLGKIRKLFSFYTFISLHDLQVKKK
jgi:hypothetical protein